MFRLNTCLSDVFGQVHVFNGHSDQRTEEAPQKEEMECSIKSTSYIVIIQLYQSPDREHMNTIH